MQGEARCLEDRGWLAGLEGPRAAASRSQWAGRGDGNRGRGSLPQTLKYK